ncbi:type VII secretion protein EssC [Streptococcus cuniculi]|uniref:Type VII secretion protein EssC n=2 Tax=Streptococcus cuniculi TaxID=1432788 RepID=A0A4Y9JFT0_9STRE|nr:type VII secretion protein EssC [Streptococcus cuniculi]TFU98705.1 type VII secretion protein EssC [Streptococcus cuniculi]
MMLHQQKLIINKAVDFIYFENQLVTHQKVLEFSIGSVLVTTDFMLEKRRNNWSLTTFSNNLTLHTKAILVEPYQGDYPQGFPDYRRKPRLNLEVPTDKFRLQMIDKASHSKKQTVLRAILPPLGMLTATGVSTVLSGNNPLMMLSMGMMSIMTISFSISQYVTDRNEQKKETETKQLDYKRYLVSVIADIEKVYSKENSILHYHHPSPEKLMEAIKEYDSRIYERQVANKDFLDVSLGTSQQASSLKIDSDVNPKDFSEEAQHVQSLVKHYSLQRDVPTPISLLNQSLGLVARSEVASVFMETLLLQIAFFHSYQDVNFIHLLPRSDFSRTWSKWRFLPHFQLRELNMRGLIYNNQLKEIVLNSFYQLLVKRKQVVAESGKERPIFSPHYIFTIFEDSYLAGHSINELLAEDMSELGVTVIWIKENAHYLPETISSLVELSDLTKGRLVTDNHVYVERSFAPYLVSEDMESTVRQLANLNHLEVEKNAIPESLSLLEQYDVTRVEELQILERWKKAEPNKSIRSLIGWRGKQDYVYWDLHERAHGPHALVGGTTGSGKSEFLTTYLLGLAINFSPEDVGMLIIDWKGGGIANTLASLPHFMGAITNLDGAGTARALASIKAELDKRQREFAKYGVNNINAYMNLYKNRHQPKEDVIYPTKPLPHLILVSDEFAELKSNVPEFLDELTSVARIGRSLGVHLILATQKPSGVVNDQIEANSTSKIALKMASPQDSNELLKTPDAAHITNPGRGYLKVGQNEVYDLFQSGYAGVTYDPEQVMGEQVDERIFRINDLGQHELLYDPDEDVIQGKDTSDLPTQLEAVIMEVNQVFNGSTFVRPERPWLPNLEEHLATPAVAQTSERQVSVPLGIVDKPSEQIQINYNYNLFEMSHTVIFGSPGYGKTTVLQTIVMNLARLNTPEQLHYYLLDFGNNGLLPLKDLPQVADIVTLEEDEKLQKMLERLSEILAYRKKQFKDVGVANLSQYERKTSVVLPIVVVIVDSYDGVTPNDLRKEKIDEIMVQLLREGASLGIYLIFTANRLGSVRMNMMSNIATKMTLFLNDESEISALMGREKVSPQPITGRGQVMLETPTAIQFYLPVVQEEDEELLTILESEVSKWRREWTGCRPEAIPMVPEHLSITDFEQWIGQPEAQTLYIGLNKQSAQIVSFPLFNGRTLGVFTESIKQNQVLLPRMMEQLTSTPDIEIIMIDTLSNLKDLAGKVTVYIDRNQIQQQKEDLKIALEAVVGQNITRRLIIINGLAELVEKLMWRPEEVTEFLSYAGTTNQFVFIDQLSKVGTGYGGITAIVKDTVSDILFGGDFQQQRFVDQLTTKQRRATYPRHILHYLQDDIVVDVVIPVQEMNHD